MNTPEQVTEQVSAETQVSSTKRPWAVLTLAFLALYLASVFPAFPPQGDAADYAALVAHGVFNLRTPHIGYYAFAYPFAQLAQFLGIPTVLVLNALAALCMGFAIGISYWIYLELGLGPRASLLAAASLGIAGIFWYHAAFAEVQALLILSLVTAILLYLRSRPVLAGGMFAWSMLVSQAAAPSALVFPVLAMHNRNWRAFWVCALSGTLFLALGVAPLAADYFAGPRGVGPSMAYYPPGPLHKMVLLYLFRVIESHNVLVIPAVIGLVASARRAPWLLALAIALWLGHAWLNLRLGHIEYGFAWMPVFLASAGLCGVGLCWLEARLRSALARRTTSLLLLLALVLSGAYYVFPKRQDAVDLKTIVHAVHQYAAPHPVVMTAHQGFVYTYEVDPGTANVFTGPWRLAPSTPVEWSELVEREPQIYVFEYQPHTHPLRRWIFDNPLSRRWLDDRRRAEMMTELPDSMTESLMTLPPSLVVEELHRWPRAWLGRVRAKANAPGLSTSSHHAARWGAPRLFEPRTGPSAIMAD